MSNTEKSNVRLNQAKKRKKYQIQTLHCDGDVLGKFNKLGFAPGEIVELRRKAPLFGSPMLFQIDHSQYALTKSEAALVEVVEVEAE